MNLKLKPAVQKHWLFLIAGLMWSAVGIMLLRLAYNWLFPFSWLKALPFETSGLILAFIAFKFGFSRLAKKNIDRLNKLGEKPCIFAFQAWKSYLIIVFMVFLGVTLRNSQIPKIFLSVVYTTVGGALLLSSFYYYGSLRRLLGTKT